MNKKDIDKIKEFARYVISVYCWGYSEPDGGDIQEQAEKLGLIKRHIATEIDVDPEFDDYEVGDIIYRFSKLLMDDTDDKT